MAKSTDKKAIKKSNIDSNAGASTTNIKVSKTKPIKAKKSTSSEKNSKNKALDTGLKPISAPKAISKLIVKKNTSEIQSKGSKIVNQNKIKNHTPKIESILESKKDKKAVTKLVENIESQKVEPKPKSKNIKKSAKVAPAPTKAEVKTEAKQENLNKIKVDKQQKELKLVLKSELENKDKQDSVPEKSIEKTTESKTKNNKKAAKVAPAPTKAEVKSEAKTENINNNIKVDKPQKELKLVLKSELENKDKQDRVPEKSIEITAEPKSKNIKKSAKVAPAPTKTEVKTDAKQENLNNKTKADKPQKELKLVLKSELENKDKEDSVPEKSIEKTTESKTKNIKKSAKVAPAPTKTEVKTEAKQENLNNIKADKPQKELKLVLKSELESKDKQDSVPEKSIEKTTESKTKNIKKSAKVAPAPTKAEVKTESKQENINNNIKADKPQKELKLVLKSELESKDKQDSVPEKSIEVTAEPKTKNNKKSAKVAPAPTKTEVKTESKQENLNNKTKADKPQKELKLVLKSELENKDKQDSVPEKSIEITANINQNKINKSNQTNRNINKNLPKIQEDKIDIEKYFRTGEYIINSKNDTKIKNSNKNNNTKKENNEKQLKINTKELVSISQSRDPYFKKIYSQIESFIDKELYLDDKIKIVIGVSGGVDSTVLFDILANISVKREYTLFVAHVDHSLRKESEKDTEYVKNLCTKYNVKFFTKKINVKEHSHKKKISIEEAARDLRYEFLEEVCAKTGANFLALAHNSNDSAETFFINLLRGTGLSGLSGIPQKRPLNTQVNIIRPVINLSRAEIEEYAKKRNIQWVEDTSNKENIYLRNKIRNELLPFIQEKFDRDIIGSISKASKLINGADVFIYHKIKKYLNDVLIEKKTSYVEIDLKKLFLFDDFVKGEIINLILKNIFEINNISQNIVKGIINLYFSEPGAIFEINSKITCYKDRNSLFIARKQLFRTNSLVIDNLGEFKFENSIFKLSKIPKNKIQLGELPNVEYFDLDYMPDKLEIRHIQDGDKFTPIGMTGRMKVSDFLVNNKIPLLKKKDILVLTDRVNIVWVCGLRIADKYKITPSTKKVLKVEIIEKNG